MKQPFVLLWLSLLCVSCAAGGRRPLGPDGMERNRLFAEVLKREDLRVLGNDDFFPTHLRDASQPKVQERCATALGRIGDPRSLPWLYEALRASYAPVRAAAAFAVGETEDRDLLRAERRNADARAVAELRTLLGDPSVIVRMRAVEALGKIGRDEDALGIIQNLEGISYDRSPRQRTFLCMAITALMRLKNLAARPWLERLAVAGDPEIQWRVANAFFRMRDKEAQPVLRHLLQSSETHVRAHAARALGMCGDPSLAALLIPLLPAVDRHSGIAIPLAVRMCALQALESLKSQQAVASIAAALESAPIRLSNPDQYNFAAQAAAALGNIGSEAASPALQKLLFVPGPVADSAVVALARLHSGKPEPFFALVSAARRDSAPSLHAWAAAMGELGGDRARTELKKMLLRAADEDAGPLDRLAVPAVLQALARTQEPDLPLILESYLTSHDAVVRRAAVASLKPPASAATPWKPFLHAYAQIADETDAVTKVAILNALEPWIHRAEVQSFLRSALQDRARNARVAAVRLLRMAGASDVPAELGPEGARATDFTYRLAAGSRQDRTLALLETTRGTMEIELFREDAPLTVANFISLANQGFFNGLAFMRVVPFFVIQGGDPRNDQEGGPGYTIRCEINMRPFERGSIGMALAGKDTGGSQFFITLSPQPHLDGGYTCFGRVISGMSAADHMVPGDRILKVRIQDEVSFLDYRRY